jgi:hypothetical protein
VLVQTAAIAGDTVVAAAAAAVSGKVGMIDLVPGRKRNVASGSRRLGLGNRCDLSLSALCDRYWAGLERRDNTEPGSSSQLLVASFPHPSRPLGGCPA